MDPATARVIHHRDLTKRIQALMGIVAGLMADGQLNDTEILFLRTWMSENADLQGIWPASVIHRKLDEVLADGVIDEPERQHLQTTFAGLIAGDFAETGAAGDEPATLPLNDSVTIELVNSSVCHTGEFLFGTRAACERLTLKAGGMPADNVTKRTDILVVGTRVSRAWAQTSYGRKIEAAVKLQDGGHPIEIISERRWLEATGGSLPA
jgi:NAD-dependent DNA ligase